MKQEIRHLLDNYNWEQGIITLAGYAASLFRLYRISRIRLPANLQPEDIVSEVIDKVYSGERKWDPITDPDLHKYLKSVVKSVISNTSRLDDSKNRQSVEQVHEELQWDDCDIGFEMDYKQLEESVGKALQNKGDLCLVYKALKDGLKPGEISEEYSIEIEIVRNAQKKLNRLLIKMLLTTNNNKETNDRRQKK